MTDDLVTRLTERKAELEAEVIFQAAEITRLKAVIAEAYHALQLIRVGGPGEGHEVVRSDRIIAENAITRIEASCITSPSGGPCSMGVGCDESGVCYAAAHGQPDRCPRLALSEATLKENAR